MGGVPAENTLRLRRRQFNLAGRPLGMHLGAPAEIPGLWDRTLRAWDVAKFFLDKPEARVYLRFQPYAIVQQVLHVLNPCGTMSSANFLESGFKEASMWILDRHLFLSVIGRRGGAAMLLSKAVMLL